MSLSGSRIHQAIGGIEVSVWICTARMLHSFSVYSYIFIKNIWFGFRHFLKSTRIKSQLIFRNGSEWPNARFSIRVFASRH